MYAGIENAIVPQRQTYNVEVGNELAESRVGLLGDVDARLAQGRQMRQEIRSAYRLCSGSPSKWTRYERRVCVPGIARARARSVGGQTPGESGKGRHV